MKQGYTKKILLPTSNTKYICNLGHHYIHPYRQHYPTPFHLFPADSFSTFAPVFSLRILTPLALTEWEKKCDEASILTVFGRNLWCFLSLLPLVYMGKINDTFSLGRSISHVIYGNYWLGVCNLNTKLFISFPLSPLHHI